MLEPLSKGPRALVLGTVEGKLAFSRHCLGPSGGDMVHWS